MKNYEEMAQSVLRRREIEIKRRKRAFLIGAPCAAAVLVGVAGIGTAVAAHSRDKQPVDLINYQPAAGENGTAEIAEAISSIDIAVVEPEQIDYTNPNAGQTSITVIYTEDLHMDNGADVDGCDFTEYTLDELDRFYGLRFSRFSALYPDWELSYDKLGTYTRDYTENRAGLDLCVHEFVSNRNTLNYTTNFGAKISVIAQKSEFEPLSPNFAGSDENSGVPIPGIYTEYDKKGNIISQWTPGYNPTADNSESEAFNSIINGYNANIFGQLSNISTSDIDFFAADIEMASHVRIIAEGLTDEEFLIIINDFTNNVEGPVKANIKPTYGTNPNAGQKEIKVLEIDEFNITDENIDFSDGTFYEYTLEELDKKYNLRFNILEELHPDWELSHDKLGAYNVEFIGHSIFIHDPDSFCERNTLNYTTDSGAAVSVSVQPQKFEPISDEVFTNDKPTDPSKYTTETAYADDGTPIGCLIRPIDPNDYLPEPDEGVSTVNGYEALIYRNADGNFLADLNMIFSRARITAEGLSEEEFLNVLDEFTKYKL